MLKDNETVIECVAFDPDHGAALIQFRKFDGPVNMTSEELEGWLREEQSENSGWDKRDGSGEPVGHER